MFANFCLQKPKVLTTSIYVSDWPNGVSRSTNGGTSFSSLGAYVDSNYVDGQNVFVRKNDIYMVQKYDWGVFRTQNDGSTWSRVFTGTAYQIAYDRTSGLYYCAGGGGIYSSTTGNADSWSLVYNVGSCRHLLVNGDNMIAATYTNGVGVSSDGGESWTFYTTGTGLGSNDINAVALAGSTLWVATESGVAKTTNGGTSWTNYTNASSSLKSNTINSIAYDPLLDRIYVTCDSNSGGGISYTDDAGSNWTHATLGTGNSLVMRVAVSRGIVYVTSDGQGLHISTDNAANWVQKTNVLREYIKGIFIVVE